MYNSGETHKAASGIKYSKINLNLSKKIKWINLEISLGAIVAELVIVFSEIVGSTIHDIDPTDPVQLMDTLGTFHFVFGFLLISAGFLTLIVVSLSSAWGVLEALDRYTYKNTVKFLLSRSPP
ncbi:hypothetical protein IC007_2433 [Sulfuracidifex tepidarius]|uniref:Uncharacterized protein n=1 Tax=Sulfuracidifex tepidarius TaxID=1294262 RepID=A0A510E725_9CREN|nr:hypothetical protein IC007_2433 [Sulfuracidifex tepidarius]